MKLPVKRISYHELAARIKDAGDDAEYLDIPSKDTPNAFFSAFLDVANEVLYVGAQGDQPCPYCGYPVDEIDWFEWET